MQVPLVDLKAQHATVASEIASAMAAVLEKTNFILGDEVASFEQDFAAFCGVSYAVGVDTGTSALELILRALDVGVGDEVITQTNSFIATVLAITSTGATPVLVDADPDSYQIDLDGIRSALTHRTRAIIPVHLYGHPADMDPIMEIAAQHHLSVIEDACQAHGARYKDRRVGGIGHAAAFSFYPAKNLGAYGDGGMAVTNDPELAHYLRMLRNYGQESKYHHVVSGYNRRLDTLQAAILMAKLPHLEEWNDRRRQHAAAYDRLLHPTNIKLPLSCPYAEPVYHLYVIQAANRAGLQAHLGERGIATGIHYPIPIHLQPAYQGYDWSPGQFPVAEAAANRLLSLPMYPELTNQAVEYVAQTVIEYQAAHVPA